MTTLAQIQKHVGVAADGKWGPVTAAAIAKALGIERAGHGLTEPQAFFAGARKVTGDLDQEQVDTINGLLAGAAHWPLGWLAYGLATAWHEARLKPINEIGTEAYFFRRYDKDGDKPHIAKALGNTQAGDGVRFHGRGLVQLTGRTNYERAGKFLGQDLIAQPELALQPESAARILIWGMETGAFTGKSLSNYIAHRGTVIEFQSARRIINGTDKAVLIAGHAVAFQDALTAGGW